MPPINQNVLRMVDQALVNRAASDFGLKAQRATQTIQSLPYKTSYPFYGINPLSNKSVGEYLPTWLPLAAASGLAGGTFLASPVLGGMAGLGSKINPGYIKAGLGDSASIISAAKPGIATSTLPFTKLMEHFNLLDSGGLTSMLPIAGIIGAPIALGALANAGYRLYSKAGQAKRLELLRKQLQSST
jgi:hypothetical protein